jgi:phosphatidate cytidylyltransferase
LASEQAGRAGQSELRTRIVSAAILAPAALAAVIWGGLPFAALVTLVGAIGFWEWTAIVGAGSLPAWRGSALALLVVGLSGLALVQAHWAPMLIAAPVLLFVALGIFMPRLRWLSRGMAYVAVPCAAFILLRQSQPFGLVAILFILFVVWATDIAAYFGGRALGGPKLWPRVSPKKTWSGALAGLVAAAVVGGLTVWMTIGNPLFGLLLAVPLSIAAQVGDLFESAMKRRFGVKDSGTIIPGHGGVLDRVDGLFSAAVAAWIIAALGAGGATLALPGSVIPVTGGGS